jgi:hypothetical protein
MELDAYALGNALVDVQVQVEDSMFAEFVFEKGNRYLAERDRQEEILQRLIIQNDIANKLVNAAGLVCRKCPVSQ